MVSQTGKFDLKEWYSSESAKRSLGRICQAVNEQGKTIGLLGAADRPYLLLEDADDSKPSKEEIEITIDEAKAEWSSVTAAVLFFGTSFRIHGKKQQRAVLKRNPKRSHPALKYRRALSPDLSKIASKLNAILDEIQNLGRTLEHGRSLPDIVSKLEKAADIIERRFREVWRVSNHAPGSLPS